MCWLSDIFWIYLINWWINFDFISWFFWYCFLLILLKMNEWFFRLSFLFIIQLKTKINDFHVFLHELRCCRKHDFLFNLFIILFCLITNCLKVNFLFLVSLSLIINIVRLLIIMTTLIKTQNSLIELYCIFIISRLYGNHRHFFILIEFQFVSIVVQLSRLKQNLWTV